MGAAGTLPLILVAPLGEAPREIVMALPPLLAEHFPARGVRLATEALPLPEAASEAEQGAGSAKALLDLLAQHLGRADRILGVVDAEPSEAQADFRFAEAQPGGTAAVIWLGPLKGKYRGRAPDQERLRARAGAAALHALGLTYGLALCDAPHCVMTVPQSLAALDLAGSHFCAVHEAQLWQALGVAG